MIKAPEGKVSITSIVWVDANVKSKDNLKVKDSIATKVKAKETSKELELKSVDTLCHDNVKSGVEAIKKAEKCVVIVNEKFGTDLMSKVDKDANVLSFWVFCEKSK